MTTIAKNSSESSLARAITIGIHGALVDTHTALPGSIVSFDAAKQEAEVRLEVPRIARDLDGVETTLPIANLLEVPVQFLGGGGFHLTFPVAAGDECLVFFLERDATNWLIEGGVKKPETTRKHDYSDAVALVGLSSEGNRISGFNGSAGELRNAAGDVVLRVGGSSIEIEAPATAIGNGVEDLLALLSEALEELAGLECQATGNPGPIPLVDGGAALLAIKARLDTLRA